MKKKLKIIIPIILIVVVIIAIISIIILKKGNENIDIKKVVGQWGYFNIHNDNSGFLKYYTFKDNGDISMLLYPIEDGKLNFKGVSYYSGTYETIDTKIIANLKAPPFDEKDVIFASKYDDNNNFKFYEEISTTEYGRVNQPIFKDNWDDIYKNIRENDWSMNIVQENYKDRIYNYYIVTY